MKVTTDACLFGAWVAATCSKETYRLDSIPNVLDVGTGTGLLSLMLAQKLNCHIDAIEIDSGAFTQARQNIDYSPLKERIDVLQGDVKNFEFKKQYDIIISNPPFYENDLRSPSSGKNKAHHDETLLLHELLHVISNNLSPAGTFFLLLPYRRNNELDRNLHDAGLGIHRKLIVRPSPKHDPFRIMIAGSKDDGDKQIIAEEIVIRNETGDYTDQFTSYLKDYYLYL